MYVFFGISVFNLCKTRDIQSSGPALCLWKRILVEIACRISPEAMIYSEIYHEWPQAIHGRFHREDPTFEI